MSMYKPLLNEKRTWQGYWWQPGDEKNAMPGTLTYHSDIGLTLELIGGWDPSIMHEAGPGVWHDMGDIREWPLLLGRAENRDMTLLSCSPGKTKSWNGNPPATQTIHAQTALSGVHLNDPEEKVFTKCHVSVEDLTTWSHSSVLHSSHVLKEWRSTGVATIKSEPVEDPSATVNGVVTSLRHIHTLPYPIRTRENSLRRMIESRFISFQPEEPWSLSTALKHARMVQDLLSLALHRPCAVLWIQLWLPPEEQEYDEDFPALEREVDFYSRPTVVADPAAKAIMPYSTLFTCEHIPFEEIWPRWYEVRERYLRASDMILSLRYAPPKYLELRLITVTAAAEVMHRAIVEAQETALPPPIPPKEFGPLRKALLENTPEEYQSWVKNSLRNQVTLRQRLNHLAELPDSEAMKLLIPDVEHWAGVTTRARNSLTHEGHTDKQSIDEVIVVVKVTSAVVVMNLLQALGVPGDRQREIITQHPELQYTAQQARERLSPKSADR